MAMLAVMTLASGCTGMKEQDRLADRERLKQEIRDELLAELGTVPMQQSTPPPPNSATLAATATSDPVPAAPVMPASPAPLPSVLSGGAEGWLLWGGGGLAFVRVRLVRMETFRSKRTADYRVNDFYDGQTDAEGRYRFTATEPGQYKLLWVPPGADFWVRRLADRPDVAVEPGRISVAPVIETKRNLLGE